MSANGAVSHSKRHAKPQGATALHRQKRRVFTKLIKDGGAQMSTIFQARRFLEGFETFDSKAELLAKLEDRRDHGMRRIGDLLSFINSYQDTENLLVPLLKHVMTNETARPLYLPLRNKVLMTIFLVPMLLSTLVERDVVRRINGESADCLCAFLFAIARASIEARNSESVIELAKALRERGSVDKAGALCALLLVDVKTSQKEEVKHSKAYSKPPVACWITDKDPPGGRHDNDHLNYRDVRIVPTADELRCEKSSWLPLSSEENAIFADPTTRLLDKNLRLLREDAIRTMKTNIAEQMRAWNNARIIDLNVAGNKNVASVSFLVKCDSRLGGNPNWERSRAMSHGAVVAFCEDGVPKMMGTICVREFERKGEWLNTPGGPVVGVSFNNPVDFKRALNDLQLNCAHNEIVEQLRIRGEDAVEERQTAARIAEFERQIDAQLNQLVSYDMIEVSTSFFTYQPVLRSLQNAIALPFLKELTGTTPDAIAKTPGYLPPELKMPAGDSFNDFMINLGSWSSEDVTTSTSLDSTQAEALRLSFTNRLTLIQGPPGTGKTFIGALIARMIRQNTGESILCVCHTNHALDQFLEHMLDSGEDRIVRIGGRSKSAKLARHNLRELARHKSHETHGGFRRVKQIDAQIHARREEIRSSIDLMKKPIGWSTPHGGVDQLLRDEHPGVHQCLHVDQNHDGFAIVGTDGKPLKRDFLWKCWKDGKGHPEWLQPYLPLSLPEQFQGFWASSVDDRVELMESWRREILQHEIDSLLTNAEDLNELTQERRTIQQQQDLEILRDARVVGATTTGAAQVKELLSSKAAGVVIVEEAGEVLEAHVLSALHPDTKHLILIGDHQQLRPKVESYQLTTVSGGGYNLDCSLFERLIIANLPSVTLGTQHRMRPETSHFIRAQAYPLLQDHASVKNFPDVKGITSNVLFIDHSFCEDGVDSGRDEDMRSTKTKSNSSEASLCVEVVRYLLLQGYAPHRVVVLTPCLGQLLKLVQLIGSRLKEASAFVSEKDQRDLEDVSEDAPETCGDRGAKSVRCSSIDNFQGEEADIIVGSLVRSNPRGNIGFLKEAERVNVLMSRARHGMILVGDASTMRLSRQGHHVWEPILDIFEQRGDLVKGLPTYCELHPDDEVVQLSRVEDFRTIRPNGGCQRSCGYRMSCGHACPLMCHPCDREHDLVQSGCCEPCRRVPPECHLGHRCQKLCKDECGPCLTKVGPIQLECEHTLSDVPCHNARNQDAISDLTKRCQQDEKHRFAQCGHETLTTCANARSETPVCPVRCSHTLQECGHQCARRCGECNGDHRCGEKCQRMMFCGHACGRKCHGSNSCPPCRCECSVTCVHSSCPKKCHAPRSVTGPAITKGRANLFVGLLAQDSRVISAAQKNLECGHRCPSVCGEDCPSSNCCKECSDSSIQEHVVDMVMFSTHKDHDVDSDPIIVLPCQHFYAVSTLDGHLSMNEVYQKDEDSELFVRTRPLREANIRETSKSCPDCRSVIHSIRRYGRLLRLSELRSLERKHMMSIDQSLKHIERQSGATGDVQLKGTSLVNRLQKVEERLLKSPMRKVFDACDSPLSFDVPHPPNRLLLRTWELLGHAFSEVAESKDDENSPRAVETVTRAIELADETTSTHSGARLRLLLCSLLVKWTPVPEAKRNQALELLEHVITLGPNFAELVAKAKEMKVNIVDSRKEIAEVLKAMNGYQGYNYGTSWSSHWYECPNGHPYFIGECGGAMQQSRCIECGEIVGGQSHTLASTNRQVGGVVGEILRDGVGHS